jgi:hypothetical protein
VSSTSSKTGVAYEYRCCQPAERGARGAGDGGIAHLRVRDQLSPFNLSHPKAIKVKTE